MKHLKPEGSGMGMRHTSFMHGEIFYRTGGGRLFFTLKVLRRLKQPPIIVGGLYMACGYLKAWIFRRELLVTQDEARQYKHLLNRRMFSKFRSQS
jgi:hypothetical protein